MPNPPLKELTDEEFQWFGDYTGHLTQKGGDHKLVFNFQTVISPIITYITGVKLISRSLEARFFVFS